MAYSNSTLEEELKNRVGSDYFHDYDYNSILGKIDFCVRPKLAAGQGGIITPSLLWAEAKAGESNPYTSLVQLILTIGKARTFNEYLPPPFLGAFDAKCMAFLPYVDVMEVFAKNDFNWNVTPSNYETREFKELYALVKDTLKAKSLLFYYDRDDAALRAFIKANFAHGRAGAGAYEVCRIQIDKNNFLAVYIKWLEDVKPSIAADWEAAKAQGIIDADFYLADLLSSGNMTIKDKLYVILKHDIYEFNKRADIAGFFTYSNAQFKDGQAAHKAFWAKYERPPREEYWDYIIERRDLLVPQDIRERKGSFFTPRKWVELSQEYIARALGENWQDEYTVWDPCAGTGNLLSGLTEKYNVYASTLDKQDVDVMRDRIANGANLLDAHVFQFDFLNDDLMGAKVPKSLREILADPEKRKKLVIYMNPPYAEASTARTIQGTGENKSGVANTTMIYRKYSARYGTATRELYAQFLICISEEIGGCKLAHFAKLKTISAPNFKKFRALFHARLASLFLMPSYTFDNVNGQFPIAFHVWDMEVKEPFKQIAADVYGSDGKAQGSKTVYCYDDKQFVIKWLQQYHDKKNEQGRVAYLRMLGTDVQHNKDIFISNMLSDNDFRMRLYTPITANNLIPCCIYYTIRHVLVETWLNKSDQFLFPNDGWKGDALFQSDCLVYALFDNRNCISSRHGTNHWIPFTEQEVGAGERFESHFMADFIAGKIAAAGNDGGQGNLPLSPSPSPSPSLSFSPAATAVFDAGREVWRYYHSVIKDCFTGSQEGSILTGETPEPPIRNDGGGAGVNASLYDIREYFQGRDGKGRMNAASSDAKYTERMARLRSALDALAGEIAKKVYEYGFLKK